MFSSKLFATVALAGFIVTGAAHAEDKMGAMTAATKPAVTKAVTEKAKDTMTHSGMKAVAPATGMVKPTDATKANDAVKAVTPATGMVKPIDAMKAPVKVIKK